MNILLAVLQALLALHTAIGAMWKLANPETTMPTLGTIPHGVWLALSVPELLAALALTVSAFDRRLAGLVPVAAVFVAAEMLFFSGVHLASAAPTPGPVIYWLVVVAVCAFIVYGRLTVKPIRHRKLA